MTDLYPPLDYIAWRSPRSLSKLARNSFMKAISDDYAVISTVIHNKWYLFPNDLRDYTPTLIKLGFRPCDITHMIGARSGAYHRCTAYGTYELGERSTKHSYY